MFAQGGVQLFGGGLVGRGGLLAGPLEIQGLADGVVIGVGGVQADRAGVVLEVAAVADYVLALVNMGAFQALLTDAAQEGACHDL